MYKTSELLENNLARCLIQNVVSVHSIVFEGTVFEEKKSMPTIKSRFICTNLAAKIHNAYIHLCIHKHLLEAQLIFGVLEKNPNQFHSKNNLNARFHCLLNHNYLMNKLLIVVFLQISMRLNCKFLIIDNKFILFLKILLLRLLKGKYRHSCLRLLKINSTTI